jgi:hypothetical protein
MPTVDAPLPRIRALIAAAQDARRHTSFASHFRVSVEADQIRLKILRDYELDLADLGDAAWQALKTDAVKRLIRNKRRGWAQLFDALNEAKGYAYLKSLGCTEIAFVPHTYVQPSPDLMAMCDGQQVLCEVKTIGISDDAQAAPGELSEDFLEGKLSRIIEEAKAQMESIGAESARRITCIIFHPDDSLNEYVDRYAMQIEAFLTDKPVPGVEVKVFTFPAFYRSRI